MAEQDEFRAAMTELAQAQQRTEQAQQRTQIQLDLLIQENRADRQERITQRNEDRERHRLELESIREEARTERRRMNKAWGDLANKLGTILEDIAAPNVRRLATEEFGFSRIEDFTVRGQRISRVGPPRDGEFDVVCAGPGKVICASMKSSPTLESIVALRAVLAEFFEFFPEYQSRELIGIYASWSLNEKMQSAVSSAGLYGIAMGEETMEIVARPFSG